MFNKKREEVETISDDAKREFNNAIRMASDAFFEQKYKEAYDYYSKADILIEIKNPRDIMRYGICDLWEDNLDNSNLNSFGIKALKAIDIAKEQSDEEKKQFLSDTLEDISGTLLYFTAKFHPFYKLTIGYVPKFATKSVFEKNCNMVISEILFRIIDILDNNSAFTFCFEQSHNCQRFYGIEGLRGNDFLEKAADLYPSITLPKEELYQMANKDNHLKQKYASKISEKARNLLIDMGAEEKEKK